MVELSSLATNRAHTWRSPHITQSHLGPVDRTTIRGHTPISEKPRGREQGASGRGILSSSRELERLDEHGSFHGEYGAL